MSPEYMTAIASIGTFIVIAATAVAALIQLRHLRSANQISAINEFSEKAESEAFRAGEAVARYELPRILADPESCKRLEKRPLDPDLQCLPMLANFFEQIGTLVRFGIVDSALAVNIWGAQATWFWRLLAPFIAIRRRQFGPTVWPDFEYLAVLAEDYFAKHPVLYPPGMRRMPLEDPKS